MGRFKEVEQLEQLEQGAPDQEEEERLAELCKVSSRRE